jgi:ribose transport system permease protein
MKMNKTRKKDVQEDAMTRDKKLPFRNNFRSYLKSNPMVVQWFGLIGAVIVLFSVFSYISPSFASFTNIESLLTQIGMAYIVAFGLTFVFLVGGLDVSVGSMAAFGAMLPAWMMEHWNISPSFAILICICTGLAVGWLIGVLHTKAGVNPLIVTLGMMSILRGLTNFIGNYIQINVFDPVIIYLGSGSIGPLSMPFVLAIVLFGILYFVQSATKIGRFMFATGANPAASKLCGIQVDRYRICIYMLCSSLSAFAGLVLAGRSYAAYSIAGLGWEFDAIGAVVIGGTSLTGGRGSVVGTVIGVFLMGVATNGMLILEMPYFAQLVVKGGIIIFAIWMDSQFRKMLSKAA